MAPRPVEIIRFIGRSSKRIAVTVVGGVLVVAGVAMLVLPGPGLVVLVLGFAVLGTEYAWAATALERAKRTAAQAGGMARGGASRVARGAQPAARSLGRRLGRRSGDPPSS
jgi:hypothetical protein